MQTVEEVECMGDLNEEPNCNNGEVAQTKQVTLKNDEVGKIPRKFEKPEYDEEQKGDKEEVEQTKWVDQCDEEDIQQSKHVMETVQEVECRGDLKPEIEEMKNGEFENDSRFTQPQKSELRNVEDNESTISIKPRSFIQTGQKAKTKRQKRTKVQDLPSG